MGLLNIVRIAAGQTWEGNAAPYWGFRVLQAGPLASIQVDDNTIAVPLFPGTQSKAQGSQRGWRKLFVTADANADVYLELLSDLSQNFEGNVSARQGNLDANGNLKVSLYSAAGGAALFSGVQLEVVPVVSGLVEAAKSISLGPLAGFGAMVQANQGEQIFQVSGGANALAFGDTTVYWSSAGVKTSSAIAGYDLSQYRALVLTLGIPTLFTGGTSPTFSVGFQLMQDGVTTTLGLVIGATALTASQNYMYVVLNRDAAESSGNINGGGVTGTYAIFNRPWQFVRPFGSVTGAPTGGGPGTVTLTGFNG